MAKRGRWKKEEYERLHEAIVKFLPPELATSLPDDSEEWQKIAKYVGSRTAQQCHSRWLQRLKAANKYSSASSDTPFDGDESGEYVVEESDDDEDDYATSSKKKKKRKKPPASDAKNVEDKHNTNTTPARIGSGHKRMGRIYHLWTSEEDEALRECYRLAGSNWPAVSSLMWSRFKYVRNEAQCRERWTVALDPNINRGPWTREEHERILQLYEEIGPKWAVIAEALETRRAPYMVKNRWRTLHRNNLNVDFLAVPAETLRKAQTANANANANSKSTSASTSHSCSSMSPTTEDGGGESNESNGADQDNRESKSLEDASSNPATENDTEMDYMGMEFIDTFQSDLDTHELEPVDLTVPRHSTHSTAELPQTTVMMLSEQENLDENFMPGPKRVKTDHECTTVDQSNLSPEQLWKMVQERDLAIETLRKELAIARNQIDTLQSRITIIEAERSAWLSTMHSAADATNVDSLL